MMGAAVGLGRHFASASPRFLWGAPPMTRAAKAAVKKETKAAGAKDAADRLKAVKRAAILLKQASDPTRLQVLMMLGEGEKHVGAISDTLTMSQPAVSHHLALLRHGG